MLGGMRQGIAVLSVLVLAGCSGAAEPQVVTHTVTAEAATVTRTVAEPSVTETVTVEPTQEPITLSRQTVTEVVRTAIHAAWDDTDAEGREAVCLAVELDPGWVAEEVGEDWADSSLELPREDFLAVIEDFLVSTCP